MINHDKKFIFIHIPKTGGSSIGTVLNKNAGIEETYEGFKIHHDDVTEDLLKEYFVFTFVRNPWDRLYSQYKFRNWLRHGSFDFAARNMETLFEIRYNKTLTENIPDDLSTAHNRANFYDEFCHLPSQVEFLKGKYNDGLNKFPYIDYIGRFENLQRDFDVVANKLNLQYRDLPHINKTKSSNTYREMYTQDLKNFIGDKYKDDVTEFNYTFDGI